MKAVLWLYFLLRNWCSPSGYAPAMRCPVLTNETLLPGGLSSSAGSTSRATATLSSGETSTTPRYASLPTQYKISDWYYAVVSHYGMALRQVEYCDATFIYMLFVPGQFRWILLSSCYAKSGTDIWHCGTRNGAMPTLFRRR
eukprot:3249814-Rhodomonas_salina.2